MKKKSKPFKIDLGFGDMFNVKPPKNIMERKIIPTYSGEKYAIYTNRDGVIVKHTFKKGDRAAAFRENAKAAGSYSAVSDIQLDY